MSIDIRFGFGNAIKYNAPKLDAKSTTSSDKIFSSKVKDIILNSSHPRFN